MRPSKTPILPLMSFLALASPAFAQAPAAASATARATTQALGPAASATASATTQALSPVELPQATLVPPSVKADEPVATAERMLADDELAAASADAPDEPAVADEIDKESAEMEEMRRAEEAVKVPEQPGTAPHQPGDRRIALLPELDHDLAQLQAEYDIPIEVNEAVVQYVRFFQSRVARGHFVKWLGRSHRYMDRYRAILKEEGVPQDTVFLAMIESGFGNFAYSRARASGPWQFIGPTGRLFGLKQDFWVDERRDPEKSARAAARYLRQLYEQTGDWRLAWAGYNAGVGRIFKARSKGYDDFWEMAAVPGRKVLRAETKGYVPKLMAAAIITKHPEAFGFRADEIEPQRWDEYEQVTIPNATLLGVVARAAGTTERALMDLNPELRRACTPPRAYQLKIPKGDAETFAENWPGLASKVRMTFAGHVVRRGDTLSSVAARYGVPVEGIREMNGLRQGRKLRVGQELIIPKPTGGALARAAERPAHRSEAAPRRAEQPAAVVAASEPPRPVEAAPAHRTESAQRVAAATEQAKAARTIVRVQVGDTLWSIARRLGVELVELCRWNGIENPRRHKLLAGSQLVVYAQRG